MSARPLGFGGVPRIWQLGWWIPDLDDEARESGAKRITDGGSPGPTYFVLIILSSLIASYGLLSNSTATVIGAMIVAPLMGPILGVALGIVSGDPAVFRRSLSAEVSGVGLVILVGFLVAQAAGVAQIDFSAGEIASRTRPTLYDLGIGLAAGFAGAFCMVHPGLQASVAGVAIAVALVPPLAVTGLTTAGWLGGQLPWRPAFGSFMLFMANYLTIELSACLLFSFAGFHVRKKGRSLWSFRRAITTNLILLAGTSIFLSQQLHTLVRERTGLLAARQVLKAGLAWIPGADLDSLNVKLEKSDLAVSAVVGSRGAIAPTKVADLEADLEAALRSRLPGVRVRLVVRTVSSVYAASDGYLFEPEGKAPTPEEVKLQRLETALRSSLRRYSGVEMISFQPAADNAEDSQRPSSPGRVGVALQSPYHFTPELVQALEGKVNEIWQEEEPQAPPIRLLVTTVGITRSTSSGPEAISAPESPTSPQDDRLRSLLMRQLEQKGKYEVLDLRISNLAPTGATNPAASDGAYEVAAQVRGPRLLDEKNLERVRDNVIQAYTAEGAGPLRLRLDVTTVIGGEARVDLPEP